MMTNPRRAIACVFLSMVCVFTWRVFAEDTTASTFIYVCRDAGAGGYQAFPDVCRLKDGRLMVVFYAGNRHASLPDAKWPKGGRICYCTSNDEGHTWSKADILYDGPDDNRDPSIVQLKDGRLMCNFFSIRRGTERRSRIGMGSWITLSDDLGKTWSAPRRIFDSYYCSSPIRELSNGRLIMGLYRQTPQVFAGAVGISDDSGKTWRKPVDIDHDGRRLPAETDLIELTDQTLYAVQRSDDESMCFSVSDDRGDTWSVSKPIGFKGHCPYLHCTPDGIIILGYRLISASSTCIRYSLDECKTWSDEVLVDKKLGAYPSMVNLNDGSVLIVYYEESEPLGGSVSGIRAKRFRAKPDGVEWLAP